MIYYLLSLILLIASCTKNPSSQRDAVTSFKTKQSLTSINIIDRNGFTETTSTPERLSRYEGTNFLTQQPFQKVLRIFKRDKDGSIRSIITTYHKNGELKQYLEIVDGRAHGIYAEWFPNGKQKLKTCVAEGTADIDEMSQITWSLHGKSVAWNEEGKLIAEIPYSKGQICGTALYFYDSGVREKIVPYSNGQISGIVEEWYENGSLRLQETCSNGEKEGKTIGFWPDGSLAFEEFYEKNRLINAIYMDKGNKVLATITDGFGTKCYFDENGPKQFAEFKNGKQEGTVTILEKGAIYQTYSTQNEQKHGVEIFYYLPQNKPKLSIEWDMGKMNGTVKTWYDNGKQESQREMSQNKKRGLFTAWYRDGSMMFVEDYENDRLVKGSYMKLGEKTIQSRVQDGSGVATLFDGNGNFTRKITYKDGKPIGDE